MGRDPAEVHAAAAVFDHHQDVEAAQENGVNVGEVDREDRLGVRGQELAPGRSGPSRSRIKAGFLRIVQTVDAASWWPRLISSPWIRR